FVYLRKAIVSTSVVSFLLVLIFLYRFRPHLAGQNLTTDIRSKRPSILIAHPLAAAFVLQLPLGLALVRNAPRPLLALLLLASLLPIVRILRHEAPYAGRGLYLLAAFFAISALLDIIPVDSPLRRIVFLSLVTGGIAVLTWMLKRQAFRGLFGRSTKP